jgi:hypothetical protein
MGLVKESPIHYRSYFEMLNAGSEILILTGSSINSVSTVPEPIKNTVLYRQFRTRWTTLWVQFFWLFLTVIDENLISPKPRYFHRELYRRRVLNKDFYRGPVKRPFRNFEQKLWISVINFTVDLSS